MIELLNSKKMVILILILVITSILIIILEGYLTENTTSDTKPSSINHHNLDNLNKKKIEEIKNEINKTKLINNQTKSSENETNSDKLIENTSMCWLNEDHLIKIPCSPCTDFEQINQHQIACKNTGYKELVKCKFSGEVYRSCILLNDSRSFWSFQFLMILSSSIGYLLLNLRKKQLDHKMLERLRRQLQSGV